jgi:hypothetical protein
VLVAPPRAAVVKARMAQQLGERSSCTGQALAARAYDLGERPAPEQLQAVAEGWRPYRTWASLLLRRELEDDTHEIAGPPRRGGGCGQVGMVHEHHAQVELQRADATAVASEHSDSWNI